MEFPEVAWCTGSVSPAFQLPSIFISPHPTLAQEPCLAHAEETTTQLLENAELGVWASWLN